MPHKEMSCKASKMPKHKKMDEKVEKHMAKKRMKHSKKDLSKANKHMRDHMS